MLHPSSFPYHSHRHIIMVLPVAGGALLLKLLHPALRELTAERFEGQQFRQDLFNRHRDIDATIVWFAGGEGVNAIR